MQHHNRSWFTTPTAAFAMLTLTALCLAGNHVIGRSVHGLIPPLGLSFWRWIAGTLMLAPLALPGILARRRLWQAHIGSLTLLGGLIVGSTSAMLVALNFTTAINASLINAFQPALTVLLATVFLRESVSVAGATGILLALTGVLIMLSEASLEKLIGLEFNGGDLIALAAMVGFSTYALSLRDKVPSNLSAVETLFLISLLGSLLLLPLYVVESVAYMPVPVNRTTIITVLELALLVSVFGNLMWNQGNRIIGASRASMFLNLIPLFGAILAISFLGEQIAIHHAIGALLICIGIWLIVGISSSNRIWPRR